jgi:hypothetical protein
LKDGSIRFAQPVLLSSYMDEFNLPDESKPTTPADDGQILVPCDPKDGVKDTEQSSFCTGVGKLLHMMRWSRPDILNPVRKLSRHMKVAAPAHMKAMLQVLKYCASTP